MPSRANTPSLLISGRISTQWWRASMCATIALVTFALLMIASHSTASAHATLIETTPADGEVLESQPDQIILTFTEPVQTAQDGVRLVGSEGSTSTLEAVTVNTTVEAPLPDDLPEGTYVVSWRVISLDSHPIDGAFTFSVGSPSEAGVEVPDVSGSRAVDALHRINHGIGYLGLFAATGLIIFDRFITARTTDAPRQDPGLALIAAAIAAVSSLLAIPLSYTRQQGLDIPGILEINQWGPRLQDDPGFSLLAVVIGLGGAIFVAPRAPSPSIRQWLTLGFLTISLASVVIIGHTRTYEPTWLIVVSDLVHVANGSIWFGGLIALALFLRRSTHATLAVAVIGRFSALAGWFVALLGISGIVLGWVILDSLAALFETTYGRILLVKVGLVVIAGVIAAWNHFRLRPAVERVPGEIERWRKLRQFVTVEASILVVVLLASGFLVNQSPMETPATEQHSHHGVGTGISLGAALGEGSVQGHIDPGTTGENTLILHLHDEDGLPLMPVEDPQISLSLPSEGLGPLQPPVAWTGEPGRYQASISFPRPGEWELEVVVRVSRFEEARAQISVTVP